MDAFIAFIKGFDGFVIACGEPIDEFLGSIAVASFVEEAIQIRLHDGRMDGVVEFILVDGRHGFIFFQRFDGPVDDA